LRRFEFATRPESKVALALWVRRIRKVRRASEWLATPSAAAGGVAELRDIGGSMHPHAIFSGSAVGEARTDYLGPRPPSRPPRPPPLSMGSAPLASSSSCGGSRSSRNYVTRGATTAAMEGLSPSWS